MCSVPKSKILAFMTWLTCSVDAAAQVADLPIFRTSPPPPMMIFSNHAQLQYQGDNGYDMIFRIAPLTQEMILALNTLSDYDLRFNTVPSLCVLYILPGRNLDVRRAIWATPGRFQGDRWVRTDFNECYPILALAAANMTTPPEVSQPSLYPDIANQVDKIMRESAQRQMDTILSDPPEYWWND